MLVFKISKTVALVFIFSFILQPSTIVFANDCQSDTPPISTVPGNRIIPPNWRDAYKPKIYSDSDEIARNNYVNVWVYSEGRACPPYSWSVSGTGFHFDSASGPTTATTNADLETLELWADGTACGSATISVTDGCGDTTTGYVRCTSGQWDLVCDSLLPDGNCNVFAANPQVFKSYHYPLNKRITIHQRCLWSRGSAGGRACLFMSCGGFDSQNYIPTTSCITWPSVDCADLLGGIGYTCSGGTDECCTLNLGIEVHQWNCED